MGYETHSSAEETTTMPQNLQPDKLTTPPLLLRGGSEEELHREPTVVTLQCLNQRSKMEVQQKWHARGSDVRQSRRRIRSCS